MMEAKIRGSFTYRLNGYMSDYYINTVKVTDKDSLEQLPDELKPKGKSKQALVTVTGYDLPVYSGVEFEYTGEWVQSKYGIQLKADSFTVITPEDTRGILSFLSSGYISGIGPVRRNRIVALFGDKSLEIIENHPKELLKVKGISVKTVEKINLSFMRKKSTKELALFLAEIGINFEFTDRIFRLFGHDAVKVIKENPYRLTKAEEISFPVADKSAEVLGFPKDSEKRFTRACQYMFTQMQLNGDLYVPIFTAKKYLKRLLSITDDFTFEKLWNLRQLHGDLIVRCKDCVFSTETDNAERIVANRLCEFRSENYVGLTQAKHVEECFHLVCRDYEKSGLILSGNQKDAVLTALENHISIITGGAGSGKTTTLKAITDTAKNLSISKRIILLAPTGRRAKRLSEVTGLSASTIHRQIGFGGLSYTPVPHNALVIVDESSMVDIYMAKRLLELFPIDCQIVFTGDVNQLQSVGPGSFLYEMIRSKRFPLVRLDRIYRQSSKSVIAENSYRINSGISNLKSGDSFRYGYSSDDEIYKERIIATYIQECREFGADSVAVLCAVKSKGNLSVTELNKAIQDRVNPLNEDSVQFENSSYVFRKGDRVIQTKNTENATNGDIGVITDIVWKQFSASESVAEIHIQFDETSVVYYKEDMKNVSLAYAMTIYKAQGSEYPCVIVRLGNNTPDIMLKRNLLYTAVTRRKKRCFLFGSRESVRKCILTSDLSKRKTLLADRIYSSAKHIKSA